MLLRILIAIYYYMNDINEELIDEKICQTTFESRTICGIATHKRMKRTISNLGNFDDSLKNVNDSFKLRKTCSDVAIRQKIVIKRTISEDFFCAKCDHMISGEIHRINDRSFCNKCDRIVNNEYHFKEKIIAVENAIPL